MKLATTFIIGFFIFLTSSFVWAEATDIGTYLWNMRQQARAQHYSDSLRWANDLLEGSAQIPANVQADIQLHRFYCLHKSGQPTKAEAAYKEFCSQVEQAKDDSTSLILQMRDLRMLFGLETKGLPSVSVPSRPEVLKSEPKLRNFLIQLRDYNRMTGADGLVVLHKGKVALEWYSPHYSEPIYTMSSVKSITGLLAGILVDRGKLELNAPVSKYLPSWSDGRRQRVTVEHLLTMTSGLKRMYGTEAVSSHHSEGMNAYVTSLVPHVEPGTIWQYSNEGAQLLAPVLESASGQALDKFAEQNLFEPMGLRQTQLARNKESVKTFADAKTTLLELSSFGQLVLDKGRFGNRQIVSEDWLERSFRPNELKPTYGYLWWLSSKPVEARMMQGYLNTSVWCFPKYNMVVARCQSRPYLHAEKTFSSVRLFQLVLELELSDSSESPWFFDVVKSHL